MTTKTVKGTPISHNGNVYICDRFKQWYIRVADIRHNGSGVLWQPIDHTRVPIEVKKQA
jgi:hypothetical protein